MKNSKKIQVIQVKETGNMLVLWEGSYYWIDTEGNVLNLSTEKDYQKKVAMINAGHPDFQWGEMKESLIAAGIGTYQATHAPKANMPFEGLKTLLS